MQLQLGLSQPFIFDISVAVGPVEFYFYVIAGLIDIQLVCNVESKLNQVVLKEIHFFHKILHAQNVHNGRSSTTLNDNC